MKIDMKLSRGEVLKVREFSTSEFLALIEREDALDAKKPLDGIKHQARVILEAQNEKGADIDDSAVTDLIDNKSMRFITEAYQRIVRLNNFDASALEDSQKK